MSIERYFKEDDYSNAGGITEAQLSTLIEKLESSNMILLVERNPIKIKNLLGDRGVHVHISSTVKNLENLKSNEITKSMNNIRVLKDELEDLAEARAEAKRQDDEAKAEAKRQSTTAVNLPISNQIPRPIPIPYTRPYTKPNIIIQPKPIPNIISKPITIDSKPITIDSKPITDGIASQEMVDRNSKAMDNPNSIEEPKKGLSKKVMVIGAGVLVLGLVVFLIFRNRKNG